MTDRELKKLSRAELLEMLIEQSELCNKLQKKLDSALKEAENREITINHAGTLAEAAMKLSGVFKAADDAASLYLENIQRMEREAEEFHAEKIKAVQKEADEILLLANRKSAEIIEKANRYAREAMRQNDYFLGSDSVHAKSDAEGANGAKKE